MKYLIVKLSPITHVFGHGWISNLSSFLVWNCDGNPEMYSSVNGINPILHAWCFL